MLFFVVKDDLIVLCFWLLVKVINFLCIALNYVSV